MKRRNTVPMNKEEFEVYAPKIVEALGDDILDFFILIHNVFEYFIESDTIIEETQTSLNEFEAMVRKITKVLGQEEATRFFKAVYNALPKKTITYLGVMVKVFEGIF